MFIGVHPSPRSLSECGFVIEMITNHNSLLTEKMGGEGFEPPTLSV